MYKYKINARGIYIAKIKPKLKVQVLWGGLLKCRTAQIGFRSARFRGALKHNL
jgi:hypothetical protein